MCCAHHRAYSSGVETGRDAWQARLPDIVSTLRDRWELEIFPAFEPRGFSSWAAPARRRSGEDVVVKIGWPHFEAEHEAEGLALWDGAGAVRLLDSAMIGGAPTVLLERCVPGRHLSESASPDEQDVVVARLLRRLWRPPPVSYPFRPLQEMCELWAAGAESRIPTAVALDVAMVRDGLALFRSLPASADQEVVLFTDLHARNILSAQREPWLAIDPKPYVGDPTYDALQHLLNGPRLLEDPSGLIARMAGLLDLDAARLRLWLFARCCVGAVDDPLLREAATRLAP
jgi:streptomycin 6-kinase